MDKVQLQFNGALTICTGTSRKAKTWKKTPILWSDLIAKVSRVKRTDETQAGYFKMDKAKQDEIKDVGGFVGGDLEDGRRSAQTVGNRQLITLDADFATKDLWESVELFFGYACACYSTHKHTPEKPRLRLLIPLSRPVTPDEYQAISRKVAEQFGMDIFDDTTYQPHRLMYWPSASSDADFYFRYQDLKWLDADEVLNQYTDWHNQADWPVSSRQAKIVEYQKKQQADPTTKQGVIGTFCRCYTIQEAIDTFLSDLYERDNGKDDRYTFKNGSTTGGAVVYEDKFLYSHHSTDPTSMQLCNAFDLVRIHKFGQQDEGKSFSDITKAPSWAAMLNFASNDKEVKKVILREKAAEVQDDFKPLDDLPDEKDNSWIEKLKVSKTGQVLSTRNNIRIILNHDPRLKGVLGWDQFSQRIAVLRNPPWRGKNDSPYWEDGDDAELRYMLETYYEIEGKQKIEDETINAANHHTFHKVRDYLGSLTWDGKERMGRLLIDYLGAEENDYTIAVTRKMLIAAVGRIYRPGLKFDNMIVLEGRQGLGKSYILKKLGREWFSDSLTTVQGKEAYEQLRGLWIIEISELAALKKAEIEPIKQFISKQVDTYRVAYGKRLSEFPRQCVFVGTTNEATFLRDHTGNRRFWPVKCGVYAPTKSLWSDGVDEEIDQVWAEAVEAFKNGESVWLGKELEQTAYEVQAQHEEENPLLGLISQYLDMDLPENWYELEATTRRSIIKGDGFKPESGGTFKRVRVCPLEVWVECLGGDIRHFDSYNRKEVRAALDRIPGWETWRGSNTGLAFGQPYGQQKAYVRSGFWNNAKKGLLYEAKQYWEWNENKGMLE